MFWKQWLMTGWWATAGLGAVMVAAACAPGGAAAMEAAQGLLFGGGAGGPVTAGVRLMWGISGGLCLGWAAMGGLLTRHAFGERWAWWAVALSTEAWLLADSAASVLSGAPLNAVVNVVFFLALFAPPLWATRPAAATRTLRRS